jgi:hypothetical protein
MRPCRALCVRHGLAPSGSAQGAIASVVLQARYALHVLESKENSSELPEKVALLYQSLPERQPPWM